MLRMERRVHMPWISDGEVRGGTTSPVDRGECGRDKSEEQVGAHEYQPLRQAVRRAGRLERAVHHLPN